MKMKRLLALCLVACACTSKPKPVHHQVIIDTEPPRMDAGPLAAPPARGPYGPTVEACGKAADHLNSFVRDQMEPPGITEDRRRYVESLVASNRREVIEYCLQMAVPAEVDCMIAATDFATLEDCDRRRRDVGDIPEHAELTQSDCERFFDRHRQFAIGERGISPADEDANKDLIVRECLDKGQKGTVSCFIASPTWAQAERCPAGPTR